MDINKINRDGSNRQNLSAKGKKKKKDAQNSPKTLSESIEMSSEEEETNLEQDIAKKPNPKNNLFRKSIDIKV